MAIISKQLWNSLAQWRAIAFLVGGLMFIPKMIIEAADIVRGVERFWTLARVFLGAGWTAAFLGLLGFYPSLDDKRPWLARVGAFFAVIGGITMTVMAIASLGYFTGILNGEITDVLMYFIPGVFGGIVLGFGTFGIASLKTNIYSQGIGLLFLLLPLTFLFNLSSPFIGFATLTKSLIIILILTLAMLTIGYLLRSGRALINEVEDRTINEP